MGKKINYEKIVIYKINCINKQIKYIHIGYTTNVVERKRWYKKNVENINATKYYENLFIFIRQNGGWKNFKFQVIEIFPCKDAAEANEKLLFWKNVYNNSNL